MIVGYARTSTAEQVAGLEAQDRELRAAGADRLIPWTALASPRSRRDKLSTPPTAAVWRERTAPRRPRLANRRAAQAGRASHNQPLQSRIANTTIVVIEFH